MVRVILAVLCLTVITVYITLQSSDSQQEPSIMPTGIENTDASQDSKTLVRDQPSPSSTEDTLSPETEIAYAERAKQSLVEHYNGRIKSGNSQFTKITKENPDDEHLFTFSFSEPKNINEVIAVAELYNIDIKGFRHRYGEYSGGYILEEGETMQGAADSYYEVALSMQNNMIESMEEDLKFQVENPLYPEATDNLRKSIADMIETRDRLINDAVVHIVGADLNGKGRDLGNLFSENEDLGFSKELVNGSRKYDAVPFDYQR